MGELRIPPPDDGDTEDVHWALTTAASLHARGDYHEALRWLRRAVTAAVSCSQDGRAIELGRRAAELEEALAGAPTDRGHDRDTLAEEDATPRAPGRQPPAMALRTLRIDPNPTPIDGLDESTYVDAPEDITQFPFTKKAAGVASAQAPPRQTPLPAEVRSTMPEARAAVRDTLTLPAYSIEEEPTVAMKGAPEASAQGHDDITQESHVPVSSQPQSPAPATMLAQTTAPSAVEPRRVALIATADGDARVIPLAPGSVAPDGSAVALLFPVSKRDAKRVAMLLGLERRRRSR